MPLFQAGQKPTLKQIKCDLGNDTFVYLRELSAQELIELSKHKDVNELDELYANLAKCIVDEAGQPLFESKDHLQKDFTVGMSVLLDLGRKLKEVSGLEKKA
jgi:hypothetical protein